VVRQRGATLTEADSVRDGDGSDTEDGGGNFTYAWIHLRLEAAPPCSTEVAAAFFTSATVNRMGPMTSFAWQGWVRGCEG
jgi:hypothetical protein